MELKRNGCVNRPTTAVERYVITGWPVVDMFITRVVVMAVLLQLFASGCAQLTSADFSESLPVVKPVARAVWPLGHDKGQLDWPNGITTFNSSTFNYDSLFRKPGSGLDTTDVDCGNVERISTVFFADRTQMSATARQSVLLLHFEWHMPVSDGESSIHDYFKRPVLLYVNDSPRDLNLYTGGLRFAKRVPVNGIYTLVVSYRGSEIYRELFNMVGC